MTARIYLLGCLLLGGAAHAAQVTTGQLYIPAGVTAPYDWGTGPPSINMGGTADDLWCVDFVPAIGITSATKMGWIGGDAGASDWFGVAIYEKNGTSQLAEGKVQAASSTTKVSITGLSSFTLWANEEYRMCWCASSTTTAYLPASEHDEGASDDAAMDALYALIRAFVANIGYIATACTTGDPPATATGTLLAPASGSAIPPPLVILSQ